MKKILFLIGLNLLLFAIRSKSQTVCDSISIDTVYIDGNSLYISVYNSSQHFIAYPFFTSTLNSNPYISINDSLSIPTFLSVPGDANNGYTEAYYFNMNIASAALIPMNTLFSGNLSISDPNDSTFLCSKSFNFVYGSMPTALNGTASDQFLVYPNPSNGKIRVLISDDYAIISIWDQFGRMLISKETTQNLSEIDIPEYGLYILNISSRKGNVSQKIIIQP